MVDLIKAPMMYRINRITRINRVYGIGWVRMRLVGPESGRLGERKAGRSREAGAERGG